MGLCLYILKIPIFEILVGFLEKEHKIDVCLHLS